jgi:hypothetical protein
MKQLIGSDTGSYVFDPVAKTITLYGLPSITLANVLLVTNVTTGAMIYSFADPERSGYFANGVLTLEADTSAQSASDVLQVWVDLPENPEAPAFTYDANLAEVFGSAPLALEGLLRTLTQPRRMPSVVNILLGANSEIRIPCEGANTVAIQTDGTWAGTLTFQASINGADFVSVAAAPVAGGSSINTATANGAWIVNCAAFSFVRVVWTTYTSGQVRVFLRADAANGSVPPSNQATADANLPTILGSYQLYSLAISDAPQQVVAPIVNPTQPTSYAAPIFWRWPQRVRRLRVEAGGDQGLPLAQDPNTKRLIVDAPELRSLLEELLMQQALTNQLLAQAFALPLPSYIPELR